MAELLPAAYTCAARYLSRPFGPPVAAAAQSVAVGLPFLLSGVIKTGYDVTSWLWFRRVPLTESESDSEPRPTRRSA